jgi:ATP-dependent helicase/nuclease subunit B
MAVRIVAGLAGSGKSARCFARIVSAMRAAPLGPPIYWVVPRQATFSAERWLTCGSGLSAFSRCRVVSFEQLANEVIAHAGGGQRAVIGKSGRRMILAHLLRERAEELKLFRSSARTPGLAGEILGFFDEVSRQGQEGALAEFSEEAGEDGSPLGRKLGDLAVLRGAYRAFLGTGRFDKDTRMEFVLRRLGACPTFRGATFYVDGFLDLLDFERRMIVGLAGVAAEMEVTFCMPSDSPLLEGRRIHEFPAGDGVFNRVELAHRSLRVMFAEARIPVEVERLAGGVRFGSEDLRVVERVLGGEEIVGTGAVAGKSISFVEAECEGDEVDAAARAIRGLVGEGYRLREIVVLARDLGRYERLIARSFGEHGIRFFMDQRRDASCHPLVRLVRAVLSVAAEGWTTEAVATIAKCGLVKCDVATARGLEDWGIARGLRGESWAAAQVKAPAEVESLRGMIVGAVSGFVSAVRAEGGIGVGDAARRLLAVLENGFGVRVTLGEWIAGEADPASRGEHDQVWAEVAGLLDELAELLGEAVVSAGELRGIVLAGLEGLDLGVTPPTVDQVVVGPAERTRVGDAKVAIVLGLSDGTFPRHQGDSGLLSDEEREALDRAGVALGPASAQRQLDERLIGYLAMTRASERLLLFRPTAEAKGGERGAGLFWKKLREAFPQVPVATAATGASLEGMATARQLVVGLLRWARSPALRGDAEWRATYDAFAAAVAGRGDLHSVSGAVWSALARGNEAKLSAETAAKLWGVPLEVRDEQLESFAACPFQHFAKFGLKLGNVEAPRAHVRRLSSAAHRVLERITRALALKGRNFDALDSAESQAWIEKLTAAAIGEEVRRLSWDGSEALDRLAPGDQFALARLEGMVRQVVGAHRRAAAKTMFVPRAAQVGFGGRSGRAPLTVPLTRGGEVLISGSIDRVDVTPDGQRAVAWDYKVSAGGAPSLPRIYHGLSLRVLIHLLVLRDGPEGFDPSGAFAVGLRAGVGSVSDLDEWRKAKLFSSEEAELGRRKGRGLLNREHLADLVPSLSSVEASALFGVRLTTGGVPYANAREALTPEQLGILLDHAAETIGKLAERIIEGEILVRPYRLGKVTPCPRCDYAAVCRFDPRSGGNYLELDAKANPFAGAGGEVGDE